MTSRPRVNPHRPINWRFEDILTFISVLEAGSVTSAATRLNLSKSVISKRISDLEAALRVELFQRSTGQVKPTEVARSLYDRLVPLVQGIAEATELVSEREENLTGRLRVTAPVSLGINFLSPVLAEFAERYPELEITFDYEDRCVSLTQAGYDVGIRMGQLEESSLRARKLFDCARIVCCSPDYVANNGMPESVSELASHRCIRHAHARTTDAWQFDAEASGPLSMMLRSRITANNLEAMRDMAIAGLGLVLLPEFLAAEPLRERRLISVLPHAIPRACTISAVYPYTHYVSPKVRRFIDHLVAAFVPPLPWHLEMRGSGNTQAIRTVEWVPAAA